MAGVASRYSTVAILLHWTTALAVVSMIPMGLWMTQAIEKPGDQALAYQVFQLHKSIGFLILALTLARIVWRLTHRPPHATEATRVWEKHVAGAVHAAFYGLLLALPLTGWLFVSSGWNVSADRALAVPTSWFGLFNVPHIPGVPDLADEARRSLGFQAIGAHALMAWGAVVLIGLHAGAALKHHLVQRDGVLWRMAPVVRHPVSGPAPTPEPAPNPSADSLIRVWATRLAGVAFVGLLGLAGALASAPPPLASDAGVQAASTTAVAATPVVGPVQAGTATAWTLDATRSRILFSGTHAGRPFEGRFEDWDGQIWFDPADLAGSRAAITVRTASARTGDATQEGALRGREWLDPPGFPTARFEAATFRALGGDRYEATGTLRLKQTTLPIVLPFTYRRTGDVAQVEGALSLDRTALDLGMVSDAGAAWVSKTIIVRINVTASPVS